MVAMGSSREAGLWGLGAPGHSSGSRACGGGQLSVPRGTEQYQAEQPVSSAQPVPAWERPQPAPQHGWLQGRRKRPAKAARLPWLYSTGQQELWASLTVCFPGWFLVHFAGNCRNTVGMRKAPCCQMLRLYPLLWARCVTLALSPPAELQVGLLAAPVLWQELGVALHTSPAHLCPALRHQAPLSVLSRPF